MKNKTDINRILNDSDRLVQNSDDDIINTITVRVSTKNGLHKWEINEVFSDSFKKRPQKNFFLYNYRINHF